MPILKTIRGKLTQNGLGGYTIEVKNVGRWEPVWYRSLEDELKEFDGKVVEIQIEEVRE